MEIIRIYNNNVAVVYGDDGREMIVIGKGIAFHKKQGEVIETEKIEKKFRLEDEAVMSKFEDLIRDIPSVYVAIAEEIVEMIHQASDLKLSENIYLTLTDHISMSLEREQKGVVLENPLLSEIQQFYKTEYKLAVQAAKIIEQHLKIRVSDDEIGFITLHIVNASINQRFENTMKVTRMIQDILEIVRIYYDMTFDLDSIRYDRFLRHLQFFARRVYDEDNVQSDDDFLYQLGKKQFPEAMKCVKKIKNHIKSEYGKEITDSECGYLVYHIVNVTTEHKRER